MHDAWPLEPGRRVEKLEPRSGARANEHGSLHRESLERGEIGGPILTRSIWVMHNIVLYVWLLGSLRPRLIIIIGSSLTPLAIATRESPRTIDWQNNEDNRPSCEVRHTPDSSPGSGRRLRVVGCCTISKWLDQDGIRGTGETAPAALDDNMKRLMHV